MLHLSFGKMEAVTKVHIYHSHIIRRDSKPDSVNHKHRYALSKVNLLPFPQIFFFAQDPFPPKVLLTNTARSNNEPYPHPTIFSPMTVPAKCAKTEVNIHCY